MSEAPRPSPVTLAAYGAVAIILAVELVVFWRALNPSAEGDYRAYYIDKTTTCLAQPMTGAYELGRRVSFRSDGAALTRELKPCGWEGPVGDGTHSVGETSRLRFAVGTADAPLELALEMVAVDMPGPPRQRVRVSANGIFVGEAGLTPGEPRRATFPIPVEALGGTGILDIALDFPEAISPGPGVSNTRKRAIKLLSAQLSAVDP
ncbi:hypothetical protein [Devosia nitrariae]|uniref:Uncharacterized protein n=1 Tax=Devosia nitrariae TaxID=2071872 RepID=A0ABQ5W3Y8_9HYPH|nr:hypothetical protein [Devosia nitrariae]GLQ54509.1 hypothetical protein GCM10010862_17680 [Devosia nitrariae]